jgi:DNA-binding CsgD family transcriptional regulator
MPLDSGAIAAAQTLGLYARGQIADALSLCDVESALSQSPSPLPGPAATLALCHIAGGEIGGAENIVRTGLSGDGLGDHIDRACLLDARAHLRLAQHRPAEALDDALAAGELLESEFGVSNPGVVAWGSTAALACAASGDAERAEQFASEELERAQRIGVPRAVIRDVRILGLIVGGDQGLELLKQAVEIASQMAPRLESMLALVDLGAALRRSGKRAAARDPLRRALDLSHRAGATAIAERAQTELAATGARPRRLMLTGIDALTPSERRVADLAVQGITTRSMAEALFITPKTVEYHLRHIYQKLDVNSRSALADILQSA